MLRRSARLGVLIESFEIRYRGSDQPRCEPIIGRPPPITQILDLDRWLCRCLDIGSITALSTAAPVALRPPTGTPPALVPSPAVPACRSRSGASVRRRLCALLSSALLFLRTAGSAEVRDRRFVRCEHSWRFARSS